MASETGNSLAYSGYGMGCVRMKCRVKTITAGRQRLISGARFAGAVLAIAMLLPLVLLSVACGGAATPAPTGETVVVELKEWVVTPDKTSVSAGRVIFEAKNVGTIPHDGGPPAVGDIVRLSECPDASLVDRPLIVVAIERSSYQTARRFALEDHLG